MKYGVDEPPGVQNFSSWPGADAAGHLEQLAHRRPHGGLVLAGADDAARQRVDLRAGRLLRAELLEPVGAAADDERHAGQRLDVVDDRRGAVEAGDGGERRLEPRLAAVALERVEQRRLLAADVGAGAGVHDELEVVAGAEDVGAEVAGRVGLLDGG